MSIEERVEKTAAENLEHSSHLFRRTVWCRFHDGVLTINGQVPSFYLKQMAHSLVSNIEGVHHIDNELIVVSPSGISSEPAYL